MPVVEGMEEYNMGKTEFIAPNNSDALGVRQRSAQNASGKIATSPEAFAAGLAQVTGPFAVASAQQWSSPKASDIVSASVNSTANLGYGAPTGFNPGPISGLSTSPYTGGGLSVGGGASYGGAQGFQNTGGTGSDNLLAMAQDQFAQSQASNVAMLMIQQQSSQDGHFFTATSNMMNSRDSMMAAIIRNIRPA